MVNQKRGDRGRGRGMEMEIKWERERRGEEEGEGECQTCLRFGLNAQAWTTPLWPLKLCCSVGSSTVSSGMGTPPKRTILPCSIYAGSNARGLCGARGAVSMLRAFGEKVLEGTANSCRVRGVFGFGFWFGVTSKHGGRGGRWGQPGEMFLDVSARWFP